MHPAIQFLQEHLPVRSTAGFSRATSLQLVHKAVEVGGCTVDVAEGVALLSGGDGGEEKTKQINHD